MIMKNIKYVIILALFSILLACNKNAGCLSPYNDCNCKDGYEGDNCKTRVTEKFLGKYIKENRSVTDTTAMLSVSDSATQLKRVYIKKFNTFDATGRPFYGDFYGNIDGDHIVIPPQAPTGRVAYKRVEGEVCLIKENNQENLIFKLQFDSDSKLIFRVLYKKM